MITTGIKEVTFRIPTDPLQATAEVVSKARQQNVIFNVQHITRTWCVKLGIYSNDSIRPSTSFISLFDTEHSTE